MATVDKVNDNGSVYDIADSTARGAATSAETLAGEAKALATTANNKLKFNAKSEFPVEGTSSTLYIATDENKIYVWNSTNSEYDELTSSVDTTEIENRLTELEEDNVDIKNDIEDIEDKIVDLKAIKSGTLPISFIADDETEIPFTIYGNNEINNTTITGTLPLTFTTYTAGAASDWEIEGNDEPGTENLFNKNAKDADNGYVNNAYLTSDGGMTGSATAWYISEYIPINSMSYYTLVNVTGNSPSLCWYDITKTYISGFKYNNQSTITAQAPANAAFCRVTIKQSSGPNEDTFMLVKGSTAPDHYIPYQKGVGERTKNLWNLTIEQGSFDPATGSTAGGSRRVRTAESILLSANSWTVAITGADRCGVYVYDTSGNYIKSESEYYWQALPHTFTLSGERKVKFVFSTNDDAQITPSMISQAMLVEGSTAPDSFIPFGYEIPLTVSQTGQTDKNYDIFIGDSPLTEGETVSKQSTGVDLELFEGENTISTTLYNKPETSITYPDYIGVGEYNNGQWQIPLTLNDSDIIVPIDAPLVEGESVNGTFTSVIGNNTLDTTLSNKPNADIDLGSRINIIENNLTTINDRLTNTENRITAFDEGESVETSNLPITFTSNGGEISYTIYGKDAHNSLSSDTLPLIFTTATEQNAIDWIIYGNNNPGTRNLFNKDSELTADTILKSDGTTDTDINFKVSDFISVDTDTDYTLKWNSDTLETATTASICFYNINQEYISGEAYSTNNIVTVTTPEDCRFVKVSVSNDYLNNTMFVKGEIAPNTFIPYQMGVGEYNQDGYYIPIDISQDGQTTVHMDIYVGNSPLVEGDSVSKTSTNINIPLFKGENSISTTLLNKPITNVKYTDYLGVGEYVDSQWQIPLTITCGNEQTTYNIPIDAPLTDGETVSDTVEITAYEGENVLDTSLTIKPDVKIEYTYNNKINVIDSKVKAIDSEVKAIENNIKDINSNVDTLVDKINSSNTDIATLSSYISTMSEQITTMAADIEELKSKSNPVNGYVPISVNSFMSTNTTVEEVTE